MTTLAGAVARLRAGDVVAYPTETYYGLGVDALDETALGRLLALKGRTAEHAVSVLVADRAMLARVAAPLGARAAALADRFWPGPLTLVIPAAAGVPALLAPRGAIGVRISPHPLATALVAAFGGPVTTTSANPTGQPPARTAGEVERAFGDRVLVLDGGPTPGGAPSTVVEVDGDRVIVLRPGAIAPDALA